MRIYLFMALIFKNDFDLQMCVETSRTPRVPLPPHMHTTQKNDETVGARARAGRGAVALGTAASHQAGTLDAAEPAPALNSMQNYWDAPVPRAPPPRPRALAASRPKRDVPAASPSRAPAHPKKTRGVAVHWSRYELHNRTSIHSKKLIITIIRPIPKYMKVYAQWAWVCIAMHYL